ncbi:MAG: group II intron reverse transcriptase domain-containing protein [Clostridia bacterium]|nr:group II intron reverse transcriptase domain-containing protein [Clostridia bacterium]
MKVNICNIKNNGKRNYAHFDKRLGLKETYKYISIPENVEKHNFYPFIFYDKKIYKFSKEKGKNGKSRPICYASHIDRCIYQYYAYILNQMYNEYVCELNIDKCSIAYRDNKRKSNIHFAKEVFDYIKQTKNAYVIVGDFKGFFDNLDHEYLKKQICKLLNVQKLSNDMYSVFKSMTKFSKCHLEDILSLNGFANSYKGIKELNAKETVMDLETFKRFKKDHLIKNNNKFGIPQGSSLSGIFSNIYMIDFDYNMKELANRNNGLYRRYSDDFILVIPGEDINKFKECYEAMITIIDDTPGVLIERDKTKAYFYSLCSIKNITKVLIPEMEDSKNIINYLGFSFDGKGISIRPKTYGKYIYRMRRKIDRIEKCNGITYKGNKISYDKVYEKYSKKGLKKGKRKSNFISYVRLSRRIFKGEEEISNIEKYHMEKIAKVIKQKRVKYSK